MPVRRVVAHEAVTADEGRVAVERGPLVYAAEFVDNGGLVTNLVLDDQAPLSAQWRPDLLNGVMTVTGKATALRMRNGSAAAEASPLTLIPYYAWAHRGKGEMAVWLARRADRAKPPPDPTMASRQAEAGRRPRMEDQAAMNRVQLEICCGSLDNAVEAAAGGADRVELCSALFLGGLTPSYGALVEAKRRLPIPVIFMARPRGGGFCYTPVEMAAMERDTEMAVAHGADGVVFGVLEPDGRVDIGADQAAAEPRRESRGGVPPRLRRDARSVPGDGRTGRSRHHAHSDQWPVRHGVGRLAAHRAAGRVRGRSRADHARRRHQAVSVAEVVAKTGCRHVHVAAWTSQRDSSTRRRPEVFFGGALYPPEDRYDVTDARRGRSGAAGSGERDAQQAEGAMRWRRRRARSVTTPTSRPCPSGNRGRARRCGG